MNCDYETNDIKPTPTLSTFKLKTKNVILFFIRNNELLYNYFYECNLSVIFPISALSFPNNLFAYRFYDN